MTCQQGTVWIIDISVFAACPRRRRTLIPWERAEMGIEEVITRRPVSTPSETLSVRNHGTQIAQDDCDEAADGPPDDAAY